jgi:uncharacterized protein YcgL (UPF0745 family)
MKKKTLQKLKAKSFLTLLLVFFLGLTPALLKAQPIEYRSDESNNILIGTSDSRLMASIYETETTVTMKLSAIGFMKVDMMSFAFFYDPEILQLCYPDHSEVTTFGPLANFPATLDADLAAKSWVNIATHKDKGISFISRNVSGHEFMRAILLEVGCPNVTENQLFVVEEGRVKTVFEVNFKKVTTGQALENENIGIGVKTTPIAYQPKFGYDGLFLWYKDVLVSSDYRKINQDLFLYRSGSSVTTNAPDNILTTTAQLNGTFLQGAVNLPPSTTILDTTEIATSGKGKLNHDTVKKYGFIYSLDNITLSTSEFSDSLKVGNDYFLVPTPAEILAGNFSRGGNNFKIIIVSDNNGVNEDLLYSTTLTGLTPHEQYYAWAYMHYTFETSDVFQAVGNRVSFTTSDCIALNIGTVFTVEEPACGGNNGKIQVYVTGGSGSYLYSVNGEDFASYPGGLITGLEAGTYEITVQDSIQVTCPIATVSDIVLYNHNTDLNVSMTSANAGTCESKDGTLYVTVTGGKAPYTYKLNNEPITLTNGIITGKPAGVYVLNVKDASDCFAISGEVRINSDESTLDMDVTITEQAICGSNVGAINFTVDGTTNFTYQLDGYPEVIVEDYVANTPIELEGLSAGIHYIRVTDTCGEKVKEFTITNGTNGLAFTATPVNEILSCNNTLLPGSINLAIENGSGNYQYRIDGGEWQDFTSNFVITGLHYGIYRIEIIDTDNDCTYEANKVTIDREIYTPIHVGTYFTATEPTCGYDNGSIQMFVTGGSGSYLYKVNNMNFASYPGGLITGLGAGTYTIIVQDSVQTSCPDVTINNIVLNNANTDLFVSMTSDNATTCESKDGTLYVTVTGGKAPYTYELNNEPITLTNGMITGKPADLYVLNVKDASNCVATTGEVRIYSDERTIAANITVTEDAICGSSTGAISFTVTGSTSFTYQLDGYPEKTGTNAAPIVVNGLSAGVHYLHITDNCGEFVKEFTITNGTDGLAFTATPVNEILSCDGNLINGSITLNVTNGTPNYKYRVDGGAWISFANNSYTVTIPNLHTGVYVVEVKDTTGCTYEVNKVTIEREIYTPIHVGTYFTATEPSCKYENGSIQMHVTGGSGSYLYKVNNENFASYPGGLITGLGAGTYTIIVQDSVQPACPDVTINNIVLNNANTDMFVSMTSDNATTCTSPDGTLYVTVTGGEAPYTYYLNGAEITLTNGIITGKPADLYVLNVKDASDCVATSGEVRIYSDERTIAATITVTQDAICGSSTGAISFTVTGSTSFTYQLDGYPEKTGTNAAPIVVNGLSAGVHYLHITDNCGEFVKEFTITNGTNGLAFEATPVNEILSCDGNLITGSITLNVTNGTPNYKYRVDGGAWISFANDSYTVTIPNLHTGVYVVEVKDTTGCTYEVNKVTIEREIYTPIHVGTYFTATEPTCKYENGSIQMHVTGGSGSYLYKVNNENFASYPGGLITGLGAGTYTITVQDSVQSACPDVTISNIVLNNANTDLSVSMTSDNATTCASPDGTLYVTVTGGKAPYTYYLNGVETTLTDGMITGKPADIYVLNVKDVSDCLATTGEVRIYSDESHLDMAISVTKHSICGSSTGAISFVVIPATSFTYQVDGYPEKTGSGTTPISVNGLSAGVHYLRVTDNCGERVKEFTITNGMNALAFEATPASEILTCAGDLLPGSITLNVTNGTPNYKYRVDGGAWISFANDSYTVTIPNLHTGVYQIEVKDTTGCTYEVNKVTVGHETSIGTFITPPVATTPQTFCSTATVGNLQASGVDIKWYLTPTGGIALDPTAILLSDTVYYAAQSYGTCESGVRTAVKVIIDDEVILDVPKITSPQQLCGSSETLTIADIATNGNTNIVWYDYPTGGPKLESTAQLHAKTYYATIEAGTCESAPRVAVEISFTTETPDTAAVASPQYFCEGAMIGDIAVPNNKIVWYTEATGGEQLLEDYMLQHNVTYYAAQKAGECESSKRTPVLVLFTAPEAPIVTEVQGICGKATLADLVVTGAGIVWYDVDGNVLPLSTKLEVGKSYWAAQTSMGDCEGAKAKVTITDSCYVVYGTMFPFVYESNDPAFNELFPVSVKLFAVPQKDGTNPIVSIITSDALYTTRATYYDGSVYIPGTPKNPGQIGRTDNPGETIDWTDIGKTLGTPDNTPVTGLGDVPVPPVGMYKFENVVPGEYILEIYRQGYVIRWAKIKIDEDGMSLGHRELIAGDVNDDLVVDMSDLSNTNSKNANRFDANYDPRYDLNGDGNVDFEDIQIIMNNFDAYIGTYQETMDWASGY